jgi:hypothetical protein
MSAIARRTQAAKAAIDRSVREALGTITVSDLRARSAFEGLLRHVRGSTGLLRPPPAGGRYDPECYESLVSGLLALATFRRQWLRPVGEWVPFGDNPRPQFGSLARHLLAAYPVPGFMTSVWFEGLTAEARRRQGWFVHIGSGKNIRRADLPLPYTKKMAHAFLQVPDHVPVDAALRWGQVRGLGGSEGLADAIVATRLGRSFEAEEFWGTVVRFFVDHPGIGHAQVGPIVEYLHDRRFVPDWHLGGPGGDVELRPPQPDLSIKGRTPRSLLRQVAEWQKGLGLRAKRPVIRWPRCGIGGFQLTEPGVAGEGERSWAIRELLSSHELRAEGGAMHHCVAGYVRLCLKRRASIWSMTVEDDNGRRRVLTIEVDPTAKEVVQARRSCNEGPRPKDREVLGLWAQHAGLKVEC